MYCVIGFNQVGGNPLSLAGSVGLDLTMPRFYLGDGCAGLAIFHNCH